jgi:signal transduction histidine kinase
MQCARIFDALLSISHLDSDGVQANSRGFAIQDSLSRIESEFSAECDSKPLRFKVWPSDIWVDSDPVLLERILTNLVSNAVKYTQPGGDCWLRVAGEAVEHNFRCGTLDWGFPRNTTKRYSVSFFSSITQSAIAMRGWDSGLLSRIGLHL